MRRVFFASVLLMIAVLSCQSQDKTRLAVTVYSDLTVPTEIDTIRIEHQEGSNKDQLTTALITGEKAGTSKLPVRLVMAPLGAKDATVEIRAVALRGSLEVVSRMVRLAFVPHEARELVINLTRNCVGVVCSAEFACVDGSCSQPITIDSKSLPPYTAGQFGPAPDAASTRDAAPGLETGSDVRPEDMSAAFDASIRDGAAQDATTADLASIGTGSDAVDVVQAVPDATARPDEREVDLGGTASDAPLSPDALPPDAWVAIPDATIARDASLDSVPDAPLPASDTATLLLDGSSLAPDVDAPVVPPDTAVMQPDTTTVQPDTTAMQPDTTVGQLDTAIPDGPLAVDAWGPRSQTICFPATTEITDVARNGAFMQLDPYGKIDFRGLTYTEGAQKYLVMSWNIMNDYGGSSANNADSIVAVFVDNSTPPSTGNAIEIRRLAFATMSGGTVDGGALAARIWSYGDSGFPSFPWLQVASRGYGSDTATFPQWLSNAQVSLQCSSGECDTWTVTLKIPLSATATPEDPSQGLKLPAKFKFGYTASLSHTDGAGGPYAPHVYTWPDGIIEFSQAGYTSPDPASLVMAQPAGGPDTCSTGIFLDSSMIAVTNAEAAGATNKISAVSVNTFTAKPRNGLIDAVSRSAIWATFEMADCGGAGLDTSPSWIPVPGCSAVVDTGAGTVSGVGTEGTGSPGEFSISCTWDFHTDKATQCKFARAQLESATPGYCSTVPTDDDRDPEQCILVELGKPPSAILPIGAFFSSRSAYQDMSFVVASGAPHAASLDVPVANRTTP